ncbi:DEAD/DEAH box helicase [Cellulosimicrobium sp. KWT-B]|uniref:DEAD/DEAH box helicase n=1 Tax=Cellulosimicrobium sp. KWT-B TaxID=1981152 RepID=UPI00130290AF|nr:DEAD/DEAH box helicase family protein [Cellulosimicrobium sp. KWT-B]
MSGHYAEHEDKFTLLKTKTTPNWRSAQVGALGALIAHWSVHDREPATIVLPTGSGKSAIATAMPYLANAVRTLVVVPSQHLRTQLAQSFESESVLRAIGALNTAEHIRPTVVQVTGRTIDWDALASADVVVALPSSISPGHHEQFLGPKDFFDLVIVDEAHHTPAPTWRAILDHFEPARKVLLTATPRRRDGKSVPGEVVFHYPLKCAIDNGSYKAVEPIVLPISQDTTRDQRDRAIVERVKQVVSSPEHETSTLFVRAETEKRARDLSELYEAAGIAVEVLTSRLSSSQQVQIVGGLRSGTIRAVIVVGMLGEGFDLPSLRVVAYHDKHKSLPATVQLIGRLARNDPMYPQPSVVVTVADEVAFPALQGVARALWEEDSHWAELLPQITDGMTEQSLALKHFARTVNRPPPELVVESLSPVVSVTVYEAADPKWSPKFASGTVASDLYPGRIVKGQEVYYAATLENPATVLVVTRFSERPKWHRDPGLETMRYQLHLISWLPGDQSGVANGLLLVNSENRAIGKAILRALGVRDGDTRGANPSRMQASFDALDRVSISNVGVRNTYAGGRGAPSYKTFMGSSVDRGMREVDTAQGAVGHAMAQIEEYGSTYTGGIATEKSKYWEGRYVPLPEYQRVIKHFGSRYQSSARVINGLLPGLVRGDRLESFPESHVGVVAVELDYSLLGHGWQSGEGTPFELLELDLDPNGSRSGESLPIVARDLRMGVEFWRGFQGLDGAFYDSVHIADRPTVVRGGGAPRVFSDVLTANPPKISFFDGTTVVGPVSYRRPVVERGLPRLAKIEIDWSTVNIKAETDRKALEQGVRVSVHSAIASHLGRGVLEQGARRWVLLNDGPGEIADYIVVEVYRDSEGMRAKLELWHAKGSSKDVPAVRVGDMQVVVAQAIKSRRWLLDPTVWEELGRRLVGKSSPKIVVVQGDELLLRSLLGLNTNHPRWRLDLWTRPIMGEVVIAQPGLSWGDLERRLERGDLSAQQVRDLLCVFDDAVGQLGVTSIAVSI